MCLNKNFSELIALVKVAFNERYPENHKNWRCNSAYRCGLIYGPIGIIKNNKNADISYAAVPCILIILIVVTLAGFIILVIRNNSIFNQNLLSAIRLLNAQVQRPFLGMWFYKVIQGRYKGREITYIVNLLDESYHYAYFLIRPNTSKKFQLNLWKSIRITERTCPWKDQIRYSPKPLDFQAGAAMNLYYKTYSDSDFINIFEELTRAAEIFESDPYRFAEPAK